MFDAPNAASRSFPLGGAEMRFLIKNGAAAVVWRNERRFMGYRSYFDRFGAGKTRRNKPLLPAICIIRNGRYYQPMRVRELAEWLGATFEGDGEKELTGVAPLETAGASEVAFVGRRKAAAQCGAVGRGVPACRRRSGRARAHRTVIRVPEPRTAFARALSRSIRRWRSSPVCTRPAVVGKDVELGAMVYIGPHAVVGDGSRIGVATSIGAGCVLGKARRAGRRLRAASQRYGVRQRRYRARRRFCIRGW